MHFTFFLNQFNIDIVSPGGGMVDTKDLKSFDLLVVRVRVPFRGKTNTAIKQ